MKYLDEFRDQELAQNLSSQIRKIVSKPWRIMEVCGGQTHSILQYGIEDLLPKEIELLHGPGCPVCVTPLQIIDKAIAISQHKDVIFCSYGDMLRVPGSAMDLLHARASGADVRIIYSPLDAIDIAKKNPEKRVVFFAVGFETTAPANAMAVHQAKSLGLDNFFLLSSHVRVPPVLEAMLESASNTVQAFLGPGHVCSIMGTSEYEDLCKRYKIPIVIAGFEPIDILESILLCVQQLEQGESRMQNQYARAVSSAGNRAAKAILNEVFEVSDKLWRGIGPISAGGFQLSAAYRSFDAEQVFALQSIETMESPICISGQILQGIAKPPQCPAFGRECTPETPLGATMVSSEGTCASYYKFRQLENQEEKSLV